MAGGVTFWTGIEGSVAVVVTCWTSGVGSDGACCGSARVELVVGRRWLVEGAAEATVGVEAV